MLKFLFCAASCSILVIASFAQQPYSADYLLYRRMYPQDDAVYLTKRQDNVISYSSTDQLKITREENEEILLLSSNANLFSEREVDYSDFNELIGLDAKTLVPVKNSYKTIPASNIITDKSMDNYIFYDDYMEKKVYFGGVQAGAKIALDYKLNVKNPRLLAPFFFSNYIPGVESVCTYTCPSTVNLQYKLFNVDDKQVDFTKEKKGGNTVYTWKMKNVAKLSPEDQAPNPRYYMPHVIVYIADYTVDGKTTPLLSSVNDLYEWYYGFIRDINKEEPSPALRHIVDSLTTNTSSESERVKNIFYWVQDHIKYVAFEDGLQGFIPRQGNTVCDRRYGDCKDMASILTTMLHYAKIPAHFTWIGTDDIPYTYEEVPVPLNDNHMIATYVSNGNYYFLDGTSQYLPFGMPSDFIQGKEALVAFDSLNYKIVKVPEVPAEISTDRDSIILDVSDGDLKGNAFESLTGYTRQRLNWRLSDSKPGDFHKLMEGYTNLGSNKYKLDTVSIENKENRDAPMLVNYRFTIPSYMHSSDNEIFVNLNLAREFYNELIDTAQTKLDTKRDYNYRVIETYVLPYPPGYSLEFKPSDYSFQHDQFSFTAHYEADKNQLVLHKEIIINCRFLKASEYSQWNQMVKLLNKLYGESAILKKN